MTARTIPANRTRNAGRLALDLGMFAALLILLEPHGTGLAIHEWLGVAVGVSTAALLPRTHRVYDSANADAHCDQAQDGHH